MDLGLQNPALELLKNAQQTGLPKAGEPVDREKVAALAREFESMLILQMLRQMRESMLGDAEEQQDGFGLGATTLGDTMDGELARSLAAAGGLGLQKVLVDAFDKTVIGDRPDFTDHEKSGLSPITDLGRGGPTGPVGAPTAAPVAAAPKPAGMAPISAQIGQQAVRAYGATSGTDAAVEPAVPLPMAAPLSSPFGWRRDPIQGGSRFHAGVDLKVAYGQPVPVAEAGRVTFAGEQGGYGLTVVVDHGGGVLTRYAHLSQLHVQAGDELAEGQAIGRVGSSGRSTGPHLHFEVVRDGRRVDPMQDARRLAAGGFKSVAGVAD